jgi:antitoxin component YwqK of YwqJK toxin-antitoxin module
MTRRLVRYETRVHGKLQGQIWSFASTGGPTTMEEYYDGMLNGTSWQFASSGSIHARDHYENGKRHGLTEYWNASTGEPGGAELYQNGVLVGRSF